MLMSRTKRIHELIFKLLVLLLLLLLPCLLCNKLSSGSSRPWIWLYVLIVSVLSFLLNGWDKWCARHNKKRVPEKILHLFELFGGWPGSLIGQQVFRHKTRKRHYQYRLWSMILIHQLVCCLIVFKEPIANLLSQSFN